MTGAASLPWRDRAIADIVAGWGERGWMKDMRIRVQ